MSALEQEVVQKFQQLDREARLRVLSQLQDKVDDNESGVVPKVSEPMTALEWLAWAENFGEYIYTKYGGFAESSADLLEEAREERMNDLMGGR